MPQWFGVVCVEGRGRWSIADQVYVEWQFKGETWSEGRRRRVGESERQAWKRNQKGTQPTPIHVCVKMIVLGCFSVCHYVLFYDVLCVRFTR